MSDENEYKRKREVVVIDDDDEKEEARLFDDDDPAIGTSPSSPKRVKVSKVFPIRPFVFDPNLEESFEYQLDDHLSYQRKRLLTFLTK